MAGSIGFLWPELPAYAARCIGHLASQTKAEISVIATRPKVPIKGMEAALGARLRWIAPDETGVTWQDTPDLVLTGSYDLPAFVHLAQAARDAGSKVVLMADNNWTGSPRQRLLDPVRHRLQLVRHFNGVFVPGASGRVWAARMGYPRAAIFDGLYGADPELFHGGAPLAERPKTLLYVGQFVARKNVLALAQAFAAQAPDLPGWTLRLCGSGAQRDKLPEHPQIEVADFVQPPELAKMLREARCLVLPSLDEHWGLVVHEAALSGCALALSDEIGSADDLASPENAVRFKARDPAQMQAALRGLAGWDSARWTQAETVSRRLADSFGPAHFARSVQAMQRQLLGAPV